jgi:hypothetical protein
MSTTATPKSQRCWYCLSTRFNARLASNDWFESAPAGCTQPTTVSIKQQRRTRHRADTIAPTSKVQSSVVSERMTTTKWIVAASAALTLVSAVALAQAPGPKQIENEIERRGGGLLAQREPQEQQPVTWERMPHMQLEAEYAGPMKDTTIQRWRDPGLNVVCYLYLPFTAQHSPPTATGYVQYGANTIGSISCLPVLASAPPKPPGPAPSAKAPPPRGRPLKTNELKENNDAKTND